MDCHEQRWTIRQPSYGRGHWFDPSTAHQRSSTYRTTHQEVRHKYGIIFRGNSSRAWTRVERWYPKHRTCPGHCKELRQDSQLYPGEHLISGKVRMRFS
jgi:hypothetical protein